MTAQCRQDHAGQPVRARIVVFSDEEGSNTQYQWKEVVFNTLTDPDTMNGLYAQVVGNAEFRLEESQEEGSTEAAPGSYKLKGGDAVQLAYKMQDGVLHPLDYHSMLMLSMYYHYEKIVEFWRDHLGLDPDVFGKRRLVYAPKIAAGNKGEISGTLKLNAAFDPVSQNFLFFKTSPREGLPIAMNLAILAHEFGHSVFDVFAARKEVPFYETSDSRADKQIRGINEGFADFVSWVMTMLEDGYGVTHAGIAAERILPVSWTSRDLILYPKICKGSFYCKGSVLASALYEVAKIRGKGAVPVAKVVLQALPVFAEDWASHKENSDFDYFWLLQRIVEKAEPGDRADYCESFRKWFDDSVNTDKVNEVCAVKS
ncbi:MAG: hypothetical protein H6618_10070 [Deltaproteobacteria bacterium]|nr:hypothetical protein [Deltaproteobacteria bacterium]